MKTGTGKRLKPILLCPFCEHYTGWATDRKSMLEWHYHIKKHMESDEDEI
jgi:hypothetical protein